MNIIRVVFVAFVAVLAVMFLQGCALGLGAQNMTPEQIKATAGMTSCTTITTLHGKASTASANTDDIRKGATSRGKTTVTCGDATMTIETDVGVAPKP